MLVYLFLMKTIKFLCNLEQIIINGDSLAEQWNFGESFEETAKRELKEETNLDIIDSTMVKVLSGKDTYREYPNGDKLYDITAIFVITNYSGDLKVNDEESKKLEWFSIDKLPDNITSHTRNYLEKYGDILKEALIIYENK